MNVFTLNKKVANGSNEVLEVKTSIEQVEKALAELVEQLSTETEYMVIRVTEHFYTVESFGSVIGELWIDHATLS